MMCQCCGVEAPTKYVAFHQNIGMLIMRSSSSISGELCKSCIHTYFWKYTLTNMVLGWWGMISMIVNPFFILNNVGRYLFCLTMEPVPTGATTPELTEATVERIRKHMPEIAERLEGMEPVDEIARDIARKSGATPGEVYVVLRVTQKKLEENGTLPRSN